MTIYATRIASAQLKIAGRGGPITFGRGPATYNASTDTWSGATTSAASSAVRVGVTSVDAVRFAALGLQINQPVMLVVAASALGAYTPLPNDVIVFGGQQYAVHDVSTIAPDGTAILHRILAGR